MAQAVEDDKMSNGDSKPANNVGAKAFGGVVALVAIVAGVYAMVEPMNQRIDFIERQQKDANVQLREVISKLSSELRQHEAITGHDGLIQQVAMTREQFREVETQFTDMERRIEGYEEWQLWWQRTVPTSLATLNEKVYRLETETYGEAKAMPKVDIPGWVPETKPRE